MELNRVIELTLEHRFAEEFGFLREQCFPGENRVGNRFDSFDNRSFFIVLRENDELAGCGRLTPGPDSVFHSWTEGKALLPNSELSIDLGRCMIAPKYRGLGLFKVLCLAGLAFSRQKGFHYVNGASIPGRGLINMLEEIGFRKSGTPVTEYEPNGNDVLIQPMTCYLEKLKYAPEELLRRAEYTLMGAKIQLINRIVSVIP